MRASEATPAVISVNEKINEPRFPSFKGIMAAKKKRCYRADPADQFQATRRCRSVVLASTPQNRGHTAV